MSKKIQANKMADEIENLLTTYTEEVTELAKQVVDKVSQETNQEILNHITFKDKSYTKSFRIKKSFEDKRNKRNTWYVESPHYRLTHLLEYGHITRNGGRTRSFPHVKYGEQYLEQNFERELKEGIESARFENNAG